MIGLPLNELQDSPFMSQFCPAPSGAWIPRNPRSAEFIEVHLKANRKGRCSKIQLRLDRRLLKHSVLSGEVENLVNQFLELGLEERPASSSQKGWLGETEDYQEKCGQLTLTREQSSGHTIVSISEASFLKNWFGR